MILVELARICQGSYSMAIAATCFEIVSPSI